jgi:preprotein translocase subunit SecG
MLSILLFIHTILCLTLIGLVLIQQGKGADMGAAFGGGSNTVFGAGGAADFITRLTTGMAIAFMVSSIFLVKAYTASANTLASQQNGVVVDPLAGSVMEGAPEPAAAAAVATGSPVANQTAAVTPAAPAAEVSKAVEAPAAQALATQASAAPATQTAK